ncbi:MAG: four helix bundle protein [Candidatus Brachytrichaceae bacterium NZ_4S206]|jgi:four helix bundle protein
MGTSLEDLKVLQAAESIADAIWRYVVQWDVFARDVLGSQLIRATDSIGANIAESFGRFNFGEKIQFLYYARGSLFETKYWLNRAANRGLLQNVVVQSYSNALTDLARQINQFASNLRMQQRDSKASRSSLREEQAPYVTGLVDEPISIFDEADFAWIKSDPSPPISNL